jgi:putative IMPACT (imprinted ancient) family translation regulator
VLKELKKDRDIVKASYNIYAYRIREAERRSNIQDCDDDGEYLAGASLLHLLEMTDAKNVMIIVTRWHGGVPLGRDRFRHIHKCALDLLQSQGLVEKRTPAKEEELYSKLDEYFEYIKQHAPDYYTEIPESKCPKIIHGGCFEDRKSIFQAHLAVVTARDQVDQVLTKLKEDHLVAKATYNILAYRISDEKDTYIQGFDDDGEVGAGEMLLHLLQKADVHNMVVVVTRWHGDILLGRARFRYINKCVGDLLELSYLVY